MIMINVIASSKTIWWILKPYRLPKDRFAPEALESHPCTAVQILWRTSSIETYWDILKRFLLGKQQQLVGISRFRTWRKWTPQRWANFEADRSLLSLLMTTKSHRRPNSPRQIRCRWLRVDRTGDARCWQTPTLLPVDLLNLSCD